MKSATTPKRSAFAVLVAGIILVLLPGAPNASAAILVLDSVERVNATPATPVDLTAQGSLDWAYWAPDTGTALSPPVPPTNDKVSGSLIGSLSNVGGSTLRGSATSSTVERYSFTDGTSPTSGTNASLRGLIFNTDIGSIADGKGLQLTIAGNPMAERVVTLYLGGFGATANLTLSLNGVASPITDSSQTFSNANPKHIAIYTLRFRPDLFSDLLTVQYTASAITDAVNGHVGLQAVAVGIPEPGVIALAPLGALLLWSRRRVRFTKDLHLLLFPTASS